MKALVFDTTLGSWKQTRGFEPADVPAPVLDEKKDSSDADKVLIKMHFAGVCGSDKSIWHRTAFREQLLSSLEAEGKMRRIIGHESFGEIIERGSEARKRYKLEKGDFAACESHVVCRHCYQCSRGEFHVCNNEKILGISHDGCFAEYLKVPGHIVFHTDTARIRPELGAVQEPFGNAVHAASKVPLKGKTIAIFGLGPIGLFLTLVARGMGAKHIIGVEPNPVSIEMAKRLGIDYVIPLKQRSAGSIPPLPKEVPSLRAGGFKNPSPPETTVLPLQQEEFRHNTDVIDEIMQITDGRGADVSFEMSGQNSAFNNCLFAARRGGHVIAFGIKSGDFILEDYDRFVVRGLTIHAVIGRRLPETWEITQRLFADSSNKIQENIWNIILNRGNGTVLPLKDYTKERFEDMMAKHPKLLIEF